MPIQFNEPLSCKYNFFTMKSWILRAGFPTVLQRLTEHMEYSDLLNLANSSDDPLERMQVTQLHCLCRADCVNPRRFLKYVAAFAVSGLASNWLRLGKPFNPLLGETYQLKHADYRYLRSSPSAFLRNLTFGMEECSANKWVIIHPCPLSTPSHPITRSSALSIRRSSSAARALRSTRKALWILILLGNYSIPNSNSTITLF